jgi:hypothetical protein
MLPFAEIGLQFSQMTIIGSLWQDHPDMAVTLFAQLCCCQNAQFPTPTPLWNGSAFSMLAFGKGMSSYAVGPPLNGSYATPQYSTFIDFAGFGPDDSGSGEIETIDETPPFGEATSRGEESCLYSWQHTNIFNGVGGDDPFDGCWDYNGISIVGDWSNISCGRPRTFNQLPVPIQECGNRDTRLQILEWDCINNFCPQIFGGPTSATITGSDGCGYASVFSEKGIPNITRTFSSVHFAEIEYPPYQDDFFPDALWEYPQTGSYIFLQRSKRDHYKTARKSKLRFSFRVPITCYIKVWVRAVIRKRTIEGNGCFPNSEWSPIEIIDLPPVEWNGSSEDCNSERFMSGENVVIDYPYGLDGQESSELFFTEEGENGSNQPSSNYYSVGGGEEKQAGFYFKYSYLKDYEPEWGCREYFDCRAIVEPSEFVPCEKTIGIPDPSCWTAS